MIKLTRNNTVKLSSRRPEAETCFYLSRLTDRLFEVAQVEITGTLQHPVPHTLYELHPVPKDIGADFIPLEVCTRCDWVVWLKWLQELR